MHKSACTYHPKSNYSNSVDQENFIVNFYKPLFTKLKCTKILTIVLHTYTNWNLDGREHEISKAL